MFCGGGAHELGVVLVDLLDVLDLLLVAALVVVARVAAVGGDLVAVDRDDLHDEHQRVAPADLRRAALLPVPKLPTPQISV